MNFCPTRAILLGFEQIIFINYFQKKQRDDIVQINLSILKFYSLELHTFFYLFSVTQSQIDILYMISYNQCQIHHICLQILLNDDIMS